MKRRAFLAGTIATGVIAAGMIEPRVGRAQNQGLSVPDPAAQIARLDDAILAIMRAGSTTPFAHRFDELAPVVDGVFDLPGILRGSIGTRWSSLPERDQGALLDVFRRFTIASYVANFHSFAGETLEILPESRAAGGDVVVRTVLQTAEGHSIPIDYVMRMTGDTWRVVDVLLDGTISRVAVQRSDFRAMLGSGPDASTLISGLQRKVDALATGGAVSE